MTITDEQIARAGAEYGRRIDESNPNPDPNMAKIARAFREAAVVGFTMGAAWARGYHSGIDIAAPRPAALAPRRERRETERRQARHAHHLELLAASASCTV